MFKSVFSRLFWNNIVIIFSALTALILTLLLLLNDYISDMQFESDLKAAENIQNLTISLIIENPDYKNTQIYNNLLKQYSNFTDSDIAVVNGVGSVYSSTNNISKIPDEYNDLVLSGKNMIRKSTVGDFYESKVFIVGIPIKYRGMVAGGIYFSTQSPYMLERYEEYIVMMLLASCFAILIGLIMSYIQSRRITSPLKEINKGVMEIASGNFSKRIPSTQDEIGQLASSFNYMADSLERLEDMRARFISDVSHELRTPMTSISGFVGGILDGTIPADKEREYLEIVYDESVRLTKLTNDMLEMTKMQSSEFKLDVSQFDVNELIRMCIIQSEQKIDSKNLELEVSFDPDKMMVLADKDAIKRVIINVLDNAIKFSHENTKVIVKTEILEKCAHISIGNFGAGINDDEIVSIFDRFYKTDKSRNEDKNGAGLGLSMAKNIMNLHKQKIWAESKPVNDGSNVKFTKFTFTLKLA